MSSSELDKQPHVASVGSPSSNYEVTLAINKAGRNSPMVGALLGLENPMGEGSELALGTVTEVTTHNRWHEDSSFQGAVSENGNIEGMSGDDGDLRSAKIVLQAAWRRANVNSDWTPSGPNLRMSPTTGAKVFKVDDKLVSALTANTEDLHYMGELGGTDGVRLPLSIPDFSGPAGAMHAGIYGQSGSGKQLALDTPIATPFGWTTMGELKDGDKVFDENGKICNVVKVHPVKTNCDSYEVVFSDESKIVADGDHLWLTETAYSRSRESRERGGYRKRNPLLPDSIRHSLRKIASESNPNDNISINEVTKLTGLARNSSILKTIISITGQAGQVVPVIEFNYKEQVVSRMAKVNAWPAKQTLSLILEDCKKNKAPNSFAPAGVALLEKEMGNQELAEWLTVGEIANLLGRPRRNAALTSYLKKLPVDYEVMKLKGRNKIASKKVYRTMEPVTVYPKASFLNALGDYCENFRGDQRYKWSEPMTGVRTTLEILETLETPDVRKSKNHAIRVANALDLPAVKLPIAPYTLGCWLGDGASRKGEICGADHSIARFIESEGFTLTEKMPSRIYKNKDFRHWKVSGLTTILRENGLLQLSTEEGSQKHIPSIYLRASITQRKALLAGLLDTDGTVSKSGSIEFCNTNKKIIDGVSELAISLGYRATIREGRSTLNGVDHGSKWTITWSCLESPFWLPRKTEAFNERSKNYNSEKNALRYITSINKVDSVPMRCITVDSPSHLYLAGSNMIPTHNTAVTSYYLANQMRHEKMGFVIVDPQGQWSAEQGMVFSVQGFAEELGRDVLVRRISSDLRLSKDDELFTELLKHTRLVVELGLKSESTQEIVWYEIRKYLRGLGEWTVENSETLLRNTLEYLMSDETAARVYTTPENRAAFVGRVGNVLTDLNLFNDALHQFAPIHNLFQETNTSGKIRHDLWLTLSEVFERVPNRPAPLLILDMSSAPLPGMDVEVTEATRVAQRILEDDSVKAAVLRNLFSTLKRASEDKFRSGVNLNTMVVLDEAWRYAAPVNKSGSEALSALSQDLAGYARDTRKFGIGWLYISQNTTSVNLDIWDQMSIRFFGYGLSGADVSKMGEIVDDKSSLRLYRTFGNPRSTGVYPFLITGPVSPLAANATPLTLNSYNDFDDFRRDNNHWIERIRSKLGKGLLIGQPIPPSGSGVRPAVKPRIKPVRNLADAVIDSSAEVRENRQAIGLKNAEDFGDPLSDLLGD